MNHHSIQPSGLSKEEKIAQLEELSKDSAPTKEFFEKIKQKAKKNGIDLETRGEAIKHMLEKP